MLVLSRKEDQAICIGDSVKITIVKVEGKRVRLGIEAPDGVRILRGELADFHELSFGEEIDTEHDLCLCNSSLANARGTDGKATLVVVLFIACAATFFSTKLSRYRRSCCATSPRTKPLLPTRPPLRTWSPSTTPLAQADPSGRAR